jgi:hypothetical protein
VRRRVRTEEERLTSIGLQVEWLDDYEGRPFDQFVDLLSEREYLKFNAFVNFWPLKKFKT